MYLVIHLQSGHQNFHKPVFPKKMKIKAIINLPLLIAFFCVFVKLIWFIGKQQCGIVKNIIEDDLYTALS